MFSGPNSVALDAKGRMLLPAKVREQLATYGEGLILTADLEPCLLLYPLSEWRGLYDGLMSLPNVNPDTRRMQRVLGGYATDLSLDGQGRILLPPPHRKYAALQHLAMLIWQGNHYELWDEGRWDQDVARARPPQQAVPATGLDEMRLSASTAGTRPQQE
jgi:MraZ protein